MNQIVRIGARKYRHASGEVIEFVAVKSGWLANGYIWPTLRAAVMELDGAAK